MNSDRAVIKPGARLGHYEILSALGKGGMGEVWRARDTTLDRDVAIKALPDALAQDPDRLSRLEREAKLLAALNHPNVAAIHGLERWNGTLFLVLELVEGPTLEERLVQGPGLRAQGLPVDEALTLALQIAESLEAAHGKGIVHRDLKPANIKVTPEGRVKVLDFGLAKAVEPASDAGAGETAAETRTGVVMGTPSYMSPEQARGEAVDAQTDIWAFGAVLYQLLSGISPFGRKTTADTLAAVLGTQPDYSLLPTETPAAIRALLRRLLEKNQKRRLQHMGDVRIQVEDALTAAPAETTLDGTGPAVTRRPRLGTMGAVALASVLVAGLAGWLVSERLDERAPIEPVWLSMPFVDPPYFQPFALRHVAISDDGSRIAYASASRLWTRRMDEKEATSIGPAGGSPFFSPDGEWVGLVREPGLVKVPVGGGPPVVVAAISDRMAGATWRADDTIVFATSEGLFQVNADGGDARGLLKPERQRKEQLLAWPHFMPDGRSVLFTIIPDDGGASGARIASLNLETLEVTAVLTGGTDARYVSTGHLVYASGSLLKAVAFDAAGGRVLGEPISLPGIDLGIPAANGVADFALSQTGTLVYLPTTAEVPGDLRGRLRTLSWIDREGREQPLPLKPASYGYPRVSPDGARAAVEIFTNGNRDIWILNLERLILTQLTDGPTEDMLAVWSPDSERVFFASDRAGSFDVYSQSSDGATPARVEFAGPVFHAPQSVTPDGTRLIVYEAFKDTGVATIGQPNRLDPLLYRESDDRLVQVSPDGNWIVYESDESGKQFEVFIRPFPNVNESREQVSSGGGRYPVWGPKGDELFYINIDGEMMAVPVTRSPALRLGRATKLFQSDKPPARRSGLPYSVSPRDGRFLVVKTVPDEQRGSTDVSVILNFFELLR